jgi:diaminohydroxyphosphoribosylaminopyrimidine deaminase/5-amino-6-(5-phosphoribosylamino)uracil reductase
MSPKKKSPRKKTAKKAARKRGTAAKKTKAKKTAAKRAAPKTKAAAKTTSAKKRAPKKQATSRKTASSPTAAQTRAAKQAAIDVRMMKRALREARKGHPSPNPHVGAVLARGDEIVSVGHHARCGGPHAEVIAMTRAGKRARGATLYVTVEPCNHVGRTGPCTEAIIAAKVKRVVIGTRDPTRHAARGAARLRRAGVEVTYGVCEVEAEALLMGFAKYILAGVPWVTLKAAVTLDGRIATRSGDSRWITGKLARREAHRLRAEADAVLVGIGTVLADDPALTVRHVRGRQPLRVVVDTKLRTPLDAKLVKDAKTRPTLILHAKDAPQRRQDALRERGVELAKVKRARKGGLDLVAVLRELGSREIVHLLIEGGARVHGALLDAGLADQAAVFVAPRIVGDIAARPLAAGRGRDSIAQAWLFGHTHVRRLGQDLLVEGELLRGE